MILYLLKLCSKKFGISRINLLARKCKRLEFAIIFNRILLIITTYKNFKKHRVHNIYTYIYTNIKPFV